MHLKRFSQKSVLIPCIFQMSSWCGPCRVAFPHLSEIARKHRDRDLVVIGVNIEGDSPTVRKMVADQGNKMDYTVAVDAGQLASMKLMGAAGVSGIPCAFIIDAKGIIRHYGHPMEPNFARIVAQVCNEVKAAAPQAVTKSKDELSAMPVKELKAILTSWGVPFADLNEKQELVERILDKCR